jgi:hypothetical protein
MNTEKTLTVLWEVEPRIYEYKGTLQKHKQVEVRCHCGKLFRCVQSALKLGRVKSCGCKRNVPPVVVYEKPKLVMFNGKEFPLRLLTDLLGLDYAKVERRVDRDWSLMDAVLTAQYKSD